MYYGEKDIRQEVREAIYDVFGKNSNERALVIVSNMFFENGIFDYFSRKDFPTYQEYIARREGYDEAFPSGRSGSQEDTLDDRERHDGTGDTEGNRRDIKNSDDPDKPHQYKPTSPAEAKVREIAKEYYKTYSGSIKKGAFIDGFADVSRDLIRILDIKNIAYFIFVSSLDNGVVL